MASIGGSTMDTFTLNGNTSYAKAYQSASAPFTTKTIHKGQTEHQSGKGIVTSEYPSTA
jgi:hypothetical protein